MRQAIERYGINTYPWTFTMTALDCMRHLADQGFRSFELMMFPGHVWPGVASSSERNELAAFISRNNLRLTTLNQPNIDLNVGAAVPEMREYSVTALERTIMLAADLGAEGVIVGPGKANPLLPASYDTMRSRLFAALDRFTRLADRLGVQVLLENMPVGFVCRAEDLMTLLTDYGSDRIGIVYDVANGAFIGEDFDEAVRIMGNRFRFIHLSDTPKESCKHDPIIEQGIVRFREIGQTLRDIGHAEPLIVEVVSPAETADADIRTSLATLRKYGWE
jgi:sugar phosphate isomerase/epimerase